MGRRHCLRSLQPINMLTYKWILTGLLTRARPSVLSVSNSDSIIVIAYCIHTHVWRTMITVITSLLSTAALAEEGATRQCRMDSKA